MHLYFGETMLGVLKNVFESDYTWYGVFEPISNEITNVDRRCFDYIRFSIDWNERIYHGDDTANANEFNEYENVIKSGNWYVRSLDGVLTQVVEDAPVFFPGGDVSWRLANE